MTASPCRTPIDAPGVPEISQISEMRGIRALSLWITSTILELNEPTSHFHEEGRGGCSLKLCTVRVRPRFWYNSASPFFLPICSCTASLFARHTGLVMMRRTLRTRLGEPTQAAINYIIYMMLKGQEKARSNIPSTSTLPFFSFVA